MSKEAVRAAGCVLWRRTAPGTGDHTIEVALVHRDRYDDWSHPKGKRDDGEDDLLCAVREVEEETGLRGTIDRELPPVHYIDQKGRPKFVRYWSMEFGGGEFVPNDEVDQLIWMSIADAKESLSYSHDQSLLDSLM